MKEREENYLSSVKKKTICHIAAGQCHQDVKLNLTLNHNH